MAENFDKCRSVDEVFGNLRHDGPLSSAEGMNQAVLDLEEGEIPFEKPGKHRRVRAEFLDAYLQKVQARKKTVESMENEGDESGIYELTETPPSK